MKKPLKNELLVPVDCDDTLVTWPADFDQPGPDRIEVVDPHTKEKYYLIPHKRHIALLKRSRMRGYFVWVWSGNGGKWAETIVKTLGIEKYVCETTAKPAFYMDDLDASKWMGHRVWINPNKATKDNGELMSVPDVDIEDEDELDAD